MESTTRHSQSAPRAEWAKKDKATLRQRLDAFRDSDSGALAIFGLFIIIMFMVMGGIGIDLMRAERNRTVLQHTLDRAVLAAADLDQTQNARTVFNDYLTTAGLQDYVTKFNAQSGLNYKTVSAEAQAFTNTGFMRWSGVNRLAAKAKATAEERIANVEISMVLDISGSMSENGKMANLRTAARSFVDTVLSPQNQGLVSVSLVPYSEHVNAGPLLFNRYNVKKRHNYSHCIELPDSSFDSVGLSTSTRFDQMQHFQWNYTGSNSLTDTICPRYSYERITPFSSNASKLKGQINKLKPRAGTQIFMGMKWAAAMLDPAFRPVVSHLAANGKVDSAFSTRPAAYEDLETLKTVVLMTDGKNSSTVRLRDWAYDSVSDYYHWSRYNLWYYLVRNVDRYHRSEFYYQKRTASHGDQLLQNICNASKQAGIVIWGIGFEVDDHGANVMKNCASSPSHFFRVEGIEISEAFDAIARQINQLRLTQ